MKRTLLMLLFASSLAAQTPVVDSHAASAAGSVKLSVQAGDLTLAFYVPDPKVAGNCSDGTNAYVPLGQTSGTVDTAEIFAFLTRSAVANTALTITCSPTTTYRQVYAASVTGAGTPSAAAFSGSSATAAGTISAAPGDLVIAMVEANSSVNGVPAGWAALSTLDSNLLASQVANGSVSVSFPVSGAWNMMLIDIPPAGPQPPLTLAFPGSGTGSGFTLTFPIANASQVPTCNLSIDGNCMLQIEFCDTSVPPVCTIGNAGTLYLVKTVTLPVPQKQEIVVVTAKSP